MKYITNNLGKEQDNDNFSLSAGDPSYVFLQDSYLIEKLAHFNRERIAERVVHAKGSGAFGYFEVTNDLSRYTCADLFSHIGKKTELLMRFSTVGGEARISRYSKRP